MLSVLFFFCRFSFAERVDQLELDEEEGEDLVISRSDHIRKWLVELPESHEPIPHSCRTPVPPDADIDTMSEISRLEPVIQARPSDPQDTSMVASGVIDVQPSTSGMRQTCGRSAQIGHVGSEFDSDFDDEFDFEESTANAGMARDIPDDEELNERERTILNRVSTAMDEAVVRLTNVSVDFTWQSNFDTFRGMPEDFSGPAPGPIKDYDTPHDAFTDIWSRDIMEHIVLETNRYAKQVINEKKSAGTLTDSSRLHRWVNTNVDEMYVFFAIYILMGSGHRTSQNEYWKTSGLLETPMFRKVMPYNRYILLNKFIHFADNSDASQSLPHSEGVMYSAKLAKITPVLRYLNSKFPNLYNLKQDIAIDESLTLYKGRLSWVQAIRSKAARFGIKSYELCESRTGYLWKFIIYTGKNSGHDNEIAPSTDLAGKSTQVVLDLLKGLEHRGHLVTMDNFYNCPALARYLKSLGFDCLGTLRPNRKHVPVDIAKAPKSVPKGTIIARHCGDVSCIAWKDSKMVNMISTYHTAETFVGRKAGKDLVKPIAVRDYNNTMGGVDLKDQKLSMYLLERKRCVKWYMKIFKRLLNVSVLNAFIMLTESLERRGRPRLTHRDFREQLVNSLAMIIPQPPPPQETRAAAPEILRLDWSQLHVPKIIPGSANRGYCHICLRNDKQKKVSLICKLCNEFLCDDACWTAWHSLQQLTGRNIVTRKSRRRN